MKTLKTVRGLQRNLQIAINQGKTIGFVPTMGALHEGHLALVQQAQTQNDIVVVSIFVNPTQFNDASDLQKYPRPTAQDSSLLKKQKVQYLFLPSVKEIYPKNLDTKISVNLNGLDNEMEGAFRPGHFEGVVQVVHRLLSIVKPHTLYMGQKDFQQFTIIQKMIDVLNMDVSLIVCPIMREDHGLARSSRNERLSTSGRKTAKVIYQTLQYIAKNIDHHSFGSLISDGLSNLHKAGLKPEYIIIADGKTLKSIEELGSTPYIVICCAAWIDGVRLIDNIIINRN